MRARISEVKKGESLLARVAARPTAAVVTSWLIGQRWTPRSCLSDLSLPRNCRLRTPMCGRCFALTSVARGERVHSDDAGVQERFATAITFGLTEMPVPFRTTSW